MRASQVMGGMCCVAVLAGCATGSRRAETVSEAPAPFGDLAEGATGGTLARIYYWRALPGKLEEYGRYIRDVAEPIDREAQRHGAFVSVATFVSRDSASPWTHMRVFVLRDSAQLAGLSEALNAAGLRLEPDSVRRRVRGEYAATLRERAGDATVEILR